MMIYMYFCAYLIKYLLEVKMFQNNSGIDKQISYAQYTICYYLLFYRELYKKDVTFS
jgi:hypothetical protein